MGEIITFGPAGVSHPWMRPSKNNDPYVRVAILDIVPRARVFRARLRFFSEKSATGGDGSACHVLRRALTRKEPAHDL